MMEGWEEYRLGEITSMIKRGIAPKYTEQEGHIVINQKCIRDGVLSFKPSRITSYEKRVPDEKFLKIGDVLINSTGTGTLGRTAPVRKLKSQTTVDTHVTILRGNEKVDKLFLGYLARHYEPLITLLGKGSTNQIELAASDLKVTKVILPESLPTQRKIAAILSAYDDLIENNLKRIKLLEEKAQLTYEEWFVRMRFPGHETTPIDEETGLPEGWEKGKLKQLIGYQSGFAYKSVKFKQTGFPVIKIKNIENNSIDTSNTNFIDSEYAIATEKFKLNPGDLLIAMTGATVGKVGIMPITKKACYLNQRVGRFLKYKNVNNTSFVNCFFSIGGGLNHILNIAGGAAQPNISAKQILSIELVVPSEEVLSLFSDMASLLTKEVLNLLQQNQLLKEARDILLPRLMTGIIDVEKLSESGFLGLEDGQDYYLKYENQDNPKIQ